MLRTELHLGRKPAAGDLPWVAHEAAGATVLPHGLAHGLALAGVAAEEASRAAEPHTQAAEAHAHAAGPLPHAASRLHARR